MGDVSISIRAPTPVNASIKDNKSVSADINNVRSVGGTSDYEKLKNKPTLNGVEISGDKISEDYGLSDNVFIAKYGITTGTELDKAYDAGKMIFVIAFMDVYTLSGRYLYSYFSSVRWRYVFSSITTTEQIYGETHTFKTTVKKIEFGWKDSDVETQNGWRRFPDLELADTYDVDERVPVHYGAAYAGKMLSINEDGDIEATENNSGDYGTLDNTPAINGTPLTSGENSLTSLGIGRANNTDVNNLFR